MDSETTKLLETAHTLRYRLELPPIYEGELSRVYRATDLEMNRFVAVKEVLLQELSSNDKKAVKSEIGNYCRFSALCDRVPQIYTTFEHGGSLYFVTQWIEGKTLRAVLDSEPLTFGDKLDLACQLCEAVAPMHWQRFQHRDLRPENLQIRMNGTRRQLWLLDFNLTAAVPRLYRGTPGYLAPEQCGLTNHAGGGRVDVFAIGVILYEMFAGVFPMLGTDYCHNPGDPSAAQWMFFVSPSQHRAELPKPLDGVIAKCMHLNPDERYRDAREILNDLRKLRRPQNQDNRKDR